MTRPHSIARRRVAPVLAGVVAGALTIAFAAPASADAQDQVGNATIDAFPSAPSPDTGSFDWAQRARDYDAFVYDWTHDDGEFTTISEDATAFNMPDGETTYKMPAYYGDSRVLGTAGDGSEEAVNQIASVVGATLVGIDKSDQDGYDYVDMLRTFYHPDLGVAKDTPSSSSTAPGSQSIWYTTVSNVLYYMLGDLYPDATDMSSMLRSIADQYYGMLDGLGGDDADITMQDYDFATDSVFSGNRNEGGEAAAGAAAILLWAHAKFGDAKYLEGAEWAMQALERSDENLYYEVVPVLAPYIAARMNAEAGTEYDISKYLNWLLEGSNARDGWGTLEGTWGGVDVSGLVGSRTDAGPDENTSGDTGYAFAMNSFSVPLLAATAKYDARYADVIGEWMLNVDHAARYFYADQLTAEQQAGGSTYIDDPAHVIAYEGLTAGGAAGLDGTGDIPKRSSGWGVGEDATPLGLYGSSWVGFMGAALSDTNAANVVRTDLNALDFFGANPYPTSLYYNPNADAAQVAVDLGDTASDLYDSVSDEIIATNVSGETTVTVPAGHSIILVQVPAGAERTTSGDATLFDGQAVAWDKNDGRDPAMSGSTVVASSSSEGTDAAATIDDDDATLWTSGSETAPTLTLTLSGSKDISSVDIVWGPEAARSFTVETTTDGESWTLQKAVSDGSGGRSTISFPTVAARGVRVTFTDPVVDGAPVYSVRTLSANQATGRADLALGAPVTASSVQGDKTDVAASNATDGDSGTRWESATSDDQWIQVDLGENTAIGSVVISWETAAAKDYRIDVSQDGESWTTAADVTNTTSPVTTTTVLPDGTEARYVRMTGLSRLTTYAYSIFSFEVYAAINAATVNPDGTAASRPATTTVDAPVTAGGTATVHGTSLTPNADVQVTWTSAPLAARALARSAAVSSPSSSGDVAFGTAGARTDADGAVVLAAGAPSAGRYAVRITDAYGVSAVTTVEVAVAETGGSDASGSDGSGSGASGSEGSGSGSAGSGAADPGAGSGAEGAGSGTDGSATDGSNSGASAGGSGSDGDGDGSGTGGSDAGTVDPGTGGAGPTEPNPGTNGAGGSVDGGSSAPGAGNGGAVDGASSDAAAADSAPSPSPSASSALATTGMNAATTMPITVLGLILLLAGLALSRRFRRTR